MATAPRNANAVPMAIGIVPWWKKSRLSIAPGISVSRAHTTSDTRLDSPSIHVMIGQPTTTARAPEATRNPSGPSTRPFSTTSRPRNQNTRIGSATNASEGWIATSPTAPRATPNVHHHRRRTAPRVASRANGPISARPATRGMSGPRHSMSNGKPTNQVEIAPAAARATGCRVIRAVRATALMGNWTATSSRTATLMNPGIAAPENGQTSARAAWNAMG